jgi:hypothetical protein
VKSSDSGQVFAANEKAIQEVYEMNNPRAVINMETASSHREIQTSGIPYITA